MIQKIIQVGSSAGVTVPKKELEELGLKVGDSVEVYFSKPGEISSDMQVIVEARKFIKQYGQALKNLADR